MNPFLKKLDQLLATARDHGILDSRTSEALLSLAAENEKAKGVSSLAAVLSWLGGGVAFVGIILLISANWETISDGTKIAGLMVLLAAPHGVGLWIRWSGRDLRKTAEGLHFLGAGMFLAGIGLIAQIYNIQGRAPDSVLIWLLAIAPIAFLLRSPSVTALSLFALLLWGHLEGNFRGSPVYIAGSFTYHLMLEIGIGTALIGVSRWVRALDESIGKVFRAFGTFLLFSGLYLLSFYRHFSGLDLPGSLVLPVGAFLLGAAGLGLGWNKLAPESPWLRNRLAVLLGLVLVLSAAAMSADAGYLPPGPNIASFNFGWTRTFTLAEWTLSAAAWALWVLLALWCVAFGTRSGRKQYVNIGVLGVGLMVITLFFDLMGSLATTGMLFTFGGVVLLGTAWIAERWRRSIVASMGESK
jgi:uncharacterized membrane protein